MEVYQFPALNDNYCFLLHDASTGDTAVVDTPEVAPIEEALALKGWKLTHILNTHHHHDHTGGNDELKRRHGCVVVGPKNESARIPGIDVAVGEHDEVKIGGFAAKVYDTPGHTAGHVVGGTGGRGELSAFHSTHTHTHTHTHIHTPTTFIKLPPPYLDAISSLSCHHRPW